MFKLSFENFQDFVDDAYDGTINQMLYKIELQKLYKFLQENDYEIYLAQNKLKDFGFAFKEAGNDEIMGTFYLKPDRFVFFNGSEENNHEKIMVQTLPNGNFERKYEYVTPITGADFTAKHANLANNIDEETNLSHAVKSHEIHNRFGIVVYQKAQDVIVNEDASETLWGKNIISVVDDSHLNATIKDDVCSMIKQEDIVSGKTNYFVRENREYMTKPAEKMSSTEPCINSTIDITNGILEISTPNNDRHTASYAEKQIKNAEIMYGVSYQSE